MATCGCFTEGSEGVFVGHQLGTVRSFDYDLPGRPIHDCVTTLGTGVDGTVRRLSTTYEVRGLPETLTSWDNAAAGSKDVVNLVELAYTGCGQATHDYQSHSGAVNTSTTPNVQYAFASGSANTIRPASLTYPDGRQLTFNYGTPGGTDDAAGIEYGYNRASSRLWRENPVAAAQSKHFDELPHHVLSLTVGEKRNKSSRAGQHRIRVREPPTATRSCWVSRT